MNGAESLIRTLVGGGVDVSFANPGTSEMHFVSALDRVDGMRCVLCLFEGCATGAADGYARMADKPASTLLHLGPGLANGLANLHNARRARTPVVNIVGEHAVYHIPYDSPLTSDIESVAKTVSAWVKTSKSAKEIAADGAAAIVAAREGNAIATLILPADTAWGEAGDVASVPMTRHRPTVDDAVIRAIATKLRNGRRTLLYVGDRVLRAEGLRLATAVASKSDAAVLTPYSNARTERGTGVPSIDRLPFGVDLAVKALAAFEQIVLVGTSTPVAFFAYPEKPSLFAKEGCEILTLATFGDDQVDALRRLADELGARMTNEVPHCEKQPVPSGAIDPATIGAMLGALLPEGAIVCDESITTGRNLFASTRGAAPHDWLQMTGGSIGLGIPLATGAAVACPGRKIVTLQADGSGLYTAQALWTQAREKLDVLTLIWSNRSYATLHVELKNVGAVAGRKANELLSLDNPAIDWVSLARAYGVEAVAVSDMDALVDAVKAGLRVAGPFLIEVVM